MGTVRPGEPEEHLRPVGGHAVQEAALRVLRKLAEAKGLRFAAMGRAVPIPVSLSAVDTRFVDVLENVGTQCGGRADVVLKNDALEIHYRGV